MRWTRRPLPRRSPRCGREMSAGPRIPFVSTVWVSHGPECSPTPGNDEGRPQFGDALRPLRSYLATRCPARRVSPCDAVPGSASEEVVALLPTPRASGEPRRTVVPPRERPASVSRKYFPATALTVPVPEIGAGQTHASLVRGELGHDRPRVSCPGVDAGEQQSLREAGGEYLPEDEGDAFEHRNGRERSPEGDRRGDRGAGSGRPGSRAAVTESAGAESPPGRACRRSPPGSWPGSWPRSHAGRRAEC